MEKEVSTLLTDEQAIDLLVGMAKEYYHRGVHDHMDYPDGRVSFDEEEAVADAHAMLKTLGD